MTALTRGLRNSIAALAALAASGCASQSDNDHGGIPAGAKIEESREVQPTAAVHVAAGDLAIGQGNPSDAVVQYQKALALEPKNRAALYKLATIQTYARKFDQAIPNWEAYVEATGGSAAALSNLGRAYELSGDWKQAEVSYLAALKKDPTNKPARVNYGILLAKREREDEAEQQLGKVLVPAEVQYNIGSVCELRKDFAAAKQRYERALSFDPGLTAARQRLAMINGVTSAN